VARTPLPSLPFSCKNCLLVRLGCHTDGVLRATKTAQYGGSSSSSSSSSSNNSYWRRRNPDQGERSVLTSFSRVDYSPGTSQRDFRQGQQQQVCYIRAWWCTWCVGFWILVLPQHIQVWLVFVGLVMPCLVVSRLVMPCRVSTPVVVCTPHARPPIRFEP